MKYLLLFPLLSSCSLLAPLSPIVEEGPTPVDLIVAEAPGILAGLSTGNTGAAISGALTIVGGLLGWKGGAALLKKVKASPEGKVV